MDMKTLLSFEWGIMAPEFTILIVATALSLIDLFVKEKVDRRPFAWFGIAGIVIALIFLVLQFGHEPTMILNDTYRLDSFSIFFKLILLVGALLVLLMAMPYEGKTKINDRGEFYYLMLTALLGAMMMASSADLITLFVGLELLSISSYVLAGIQKKTLKSNEAALKYVINGGISTAITLFGLSYIYGLTGTTQLIEIAREMSAIAQGDAQTLAALAFIITFVGLSFKIATVPFQMWAPDVYEGSPTPITAFLSVVSKTAGFIIIIRIFFTIFVFTPGLEMNENLFLSMSPYIAAIAAITMVVGNTIALRQRNIKRLFAFSSIAHAGYLLVPFVAYSPFLFESTWFYLVAYLLMNLGAFAIIQTIIANSDSEDITAFSGLFYRSPALAIMMTIFLLSLAGIPGTAGFIGKLNIFLGALIVDPAHYVLAGIMLATTVVSYFYYFGILTQIFVRPAGSFAKLKVAPTIIAAVVFCAFGTILLGILPGAALNLFNQFFDVNSMFFGLM